MNNNNDKMPTTYECDKCCCEYPRDDLKKIDNPDIDGRFIYVCIGCDEDPDGSWYLSDEEEEDTTRHDCVKCGEEFSCGNKNENGEWMCEDCYEHCDLDDSEEEEIDFVGLYKKAIDDLNVLKRELTSDHDKEMLKRWDENMLIFKRIIDKSDDQQQK